MRPLLATVLLAIVWHASGAVGALMAEARHMEDAR